MGDDSHVPDVELMVARLVAVLGEEVHSREESHRMAEKFVHRALAAKGGLELTQIIVGQTLRVSDGRYLSPGALQDDTEGPDACTCGRSAVRYLARTGSPATDQITIFRLASATTDSGCYYVLPDSGGYRVVGGWVDEGPFEPEGDLASTHASLQEIEEALRQLVMTEGTWL